MLNDYVLPKLIGRVYYTSTGVDIGRVKIITFGSLTDDETNGLSVAEISQDELIPFMDASRSIHQHRVVLDSHGIASLVQDKPVPPPIMYELNYLPVVRHDGKPGIVYCPNGDGTGHIIGVGLADVYPSTASCYIYVTNLNQPNLFWWSIGFTLGDICDISLALNDIPLGFPEQDYSIWGMTPGPETPMWWSTDNDRI